MIINQLQENNKPIYYHGTKNQFTQFSKAFPPFFTQDPEYATGYGPIIIKAYLDIKNPLIQKITHKH